jgi:Holliday junction DNA helicase RuvA
MIAHLRGRLIAKKPGQIVVETGGVGYELLISVPTFSELPALNSEAALHVHMHVREDQIALFGFFKLEEKQLFEKLLTVSGIGPKVAMTVLSGMQPETLAAAIKANDLGALTRIPGIGKKTAERMVLELRDKLQQFAAAAPASATTPMEEDVISALTNLGFQRVAAERALSKLGVAKNGAKSFDMVFREALAVIGK